MSNRIYILITFLFISLILLFANIVSANSDVKEIFTPEGYLIIDPSSVTQGTQTPEEARYYRVKEKNYLPIDPEEVKGQVLPLGDGTSIIIKE